MSTHYIFSTLVYYAYIGSGSGSQQIAYLSKQKKNDIDDKLDYNA